MTPAPDSSTDPRPTLQSTIASALWTALGFVTVGLVFVFSVDALGRLGIPLDDTAGRPAFGWVSLLPHWLDPVALRPDALLGLRVPHLLAAVLLWLAPVCSVAVAAGLFWWWRDDSTTGTVPPLYRLGWLCLLAVCVQLSLTVLEVLFAGIDALPDGFDVFLGGLGVVSAGIALCLCLVFGMWLAAPVAVVVEGRRPTGALRWAADRATARTLALNAAFVGVLAVMRLVWARIPGQYPLSFGGFAATTVLGTAVLALAHAGVGAVAYRAASEQRASESAPRTDAGRADDEHSEGSPSETERTLS